MSVSPELMALARYMAGEFDNREQAIADPAWYVHLRLWQRPVPVPLFAEGSITLFAEQANIVKLDQPYRPRFMELRSLPGVEKGLQVQYYMPKDIRAVQGAGREPQRFESLTADQLEFLPGCTLSVTYEDKGSQGYRFKAVLPDDCPCCFRYEGNTYQVNLGFEATPERFLSYDKGINPTTGQAIWGALLGPFQFIKRQDFSGEINLSEWTRKD